MISLFFIFCDNVYADIIYKDINKPNFDLDEIPLLVLQERAKTGDKKAEYLLALHKVHGDQEEKGVEMLEQLAASGILDADESLYRISKWIKIKSLTKEKALAYLKQGADGGYAVSQYELALVYERGELASKDLEKSHYWMESAAKQGYEEALTITASDYFMGVGVPRNDVKGFEWLMKAYGMLGRHFKQWGMLAAAYEVGRGTPIDLAKAYMCYDLEGTAGIEDKARIAPHMTPEQRAEGLRLSQEWQEKNHVYTMQSLGLTRQKDGSYQ